MLKIASEKSHLYLWCPNALLAWGLQTMKAWGFEYKTNIVWLKIKIEVPTPSTSLRAGSTSQKVRR
jgi:N6-adenosine-specific RNA methylase IME4